MHSDILGSGTEKENRTTSMEQTETLEKVRTGQRLPMQLPDCPVCWDGFDDGERMPRLLHCGHTICQVCLEHLLFESSLGQRCIRCPECRGICVWRGLHELPKNYILLRVLSSSSSTHKTSHRPPKPISLGFPELFLFFHTSHLSAFATDYILRTIEPRIWDVAKLLWAFMAMLLFLPLSFAHMVLAWSTAILGSLVFLWFSLGSMGFAVVMFFLWCSYSIAQFLLDVSWIQFNRIRYRPSPFIVTYR